MPDPSHYLQAKGIKGLVACCRATAIRLGVRNPREGSVIGAIATSKDNRS